MPSNNRQPLPVSRPKHDLTQLDYNKHLEARLDNDRHETFHRLGGRRFRRRGIHIDRTELNMEDI